MGEYNRKSNRQWWQHRGKVLARVHCAGSEKDPTSITAPESKLIDELTQKEIKRSARGTCSVCDDEIALTPVGTTGNYVVRKHKAPTGVYKRKLLISEENYQRLIHMALRKGVEPDDYADLILQKELMRQLSVPDDAE